MPTTDGSLAFEGCRRRRDAFQVAKLREAGAVIIGKANLAEFANSRLPTAISGYGQVWNAFEPSKSSIGSSGGSAVAVALSLAGVRHGHADRRLALRAVDRRVAGHAARHGRHALRRGRDAADVAAGLRGRRSARTPPISRRMLNVTTGTDPDDPTPLHDDADGKRPADWTTALDADALQGKRIGYIPRVVQRPVRLRPGRRHDATRCSAQFADFDAAGATMVELIDRAAERPGHRHARPATATEEGWQQYFDRPRRTRRTRRPREHPQPRRRCSRTIRSTRRGPARRDDRRGQSRRPRQPRDGVQGRTQDLDGRGRASTRVVYPGSARDIYVNDGVQQTLRPPRQRRARRASACRR